MQINDAPNSYTVIIPTTTTVEQSGPRGMVDVQARDSQTRIVKLMMFAADARTLRDQLNALPFLGLDKRKPA
jgi:hypothetical protein